MVRRIEDQLYDVGIDKDGEQFVASAIGPLALPGEGVASRGPIAEGRGLTPESAIASLEQALHRSR